LRTRRELGLHDRFDIVDTDEHVLGLQIGMDNATFVVQVVETEEDLLGDLLDDVLRHASVLIPFYQAEQVLTQHLEDHTYVRTVRACMPEVVHQPDNVTPPGVRFRGRDDALEELNLVQCRFGVVPVGLDDLERDVTVCTNCQRDARDMIAIRACTPRCGTHVLSLASQTVEKWPHPSFRTT
jgi:hypothetical protein